MKSNRFGKVGGRLGQERNKALTLGSSVNIIDRETTREDVFANIQELLDSCYSFGVNPLPGLRKSFPDYDWKFEDCGDRHHIVFYNRVRELLGSVDFLWSPQEWLGSTVVWARRKVCDQKPFGICTKLDNTLWDSELEEIMSEHDIAQRLRVHRTS